MAASVPSTPMMPLLTVRRGGTCRTGTAYGFPGPGRPPGGAYPRDGADGFGPTMVRNHGISLPRRLRVAHEPAARPLRFSPMLGRLRLADRKSTRLNSSHMSISYAVFCLK